MCAMDDLIEELEGIEDCGCDTQIMDGKLQSFVCIYHDAAQALRDQQARIERLEKLLTTAYDLVQESLETPQYDYRARARLLVRESMEVLK